MRSHSPRVCNRSDGLDRRSELNGNGNGCVLPSNHHPCRVQLAPQAASCIARCIGTPADRQSTTLRVDRVTPRSRHPQDNGTGWHSEKPSPDRASHVSVHRHVSDRARPLGTVTSETGRIHWGLGSESGIASARPDTRTRTYLPDTVSRPQDLPDTVVERKTASSKGEHAIDADCGWSNRGQSLARISDVDCDHRSRNLRLRGQSESVQTGQFCQRDVARCRTQIEENPRSTGFARSSRAVTDSVLEWVRIPHPEQAESAHWSKYLEAHNLASGLVPLGGRSP